ncbi:DUF2953 domain-containing protein [Metabacillus herbersteinensis]|uniref:DUF2953 domain-containing protein n=1 Tax=Metabacillus herbersteinensis TaxID=283816 RepID=A0ABV6G9E7_9BACI
MAWIIGIGSFLLFVLILIIITKITVTLDLNHVGDDDHFKVKLRAWFGLLRYTINIPLVKVNDDSPNLIVKKEKTLGKEGNQKSSENEDEISPEDVLTDLKDINEFVQHIVGLHKIVSKFLKKISISRFEWHSQIGIGDAAYTGMLIGAAWSIKGGVTALFSSYMKLKSNPILTITPEFNRMCSRTKLQCIFHFRIGNAMVAGLRFVKYWKGGRPHFINRPFSFIFGDDKKNKSV